MSLYNPTTFLFLLCVSILHVVVVYMCLHVVVLLYQFHFEVELLQLLDYSSVEYPGWVSLI